MAIEQERTVNTEIEREAVSDKVQEAFKLWSSDPTNKEVAKMMNSALNEAYARGVGIAIQIAQGANGSSLDVNQKIYDKFKESDPWIQDEIVIGTAQDNLHSSRIYRGEVKNGMVSGYFSLYVIEEGERLTIINLKPDNIGLFTPITPSG